MGAESKREGMPQADLQALMVVDRVTPVPHGASDGRVVRLTAMSVLGCPQQCELLVEGPAAVPFVDALEAGTYVDVGVRLVVLATGEAAAKNRAMTDAIRRRLDEHREVDVLRVERAGELATKALAAARGLKQTLVAMQLASEYLVDAEALAKVQHAAGELAGELETLDRLLAGTATP